jgi:hypothetical protein
MRAVLIAGLVAGMGLASASCAVAAPISGAAAILGAVDEVSSLERARTFCYNRHTGRFLHWGRCRSVPRVYCRNRHTGQFLYWGACR